MSRILRKTGTITLILTLKSDEDTFKGSGYIGGQSDDELEVTFRAWVNEWFKHQFPQDKKKSILEFVSVSVSIS